MQFVDLKTQSSRIEKQVLARFKHIMDHSTYILGPEVEELEILLAQFVGVKHALTVSSGTDALLIALLALGIGHGDEVITTPFSFFATAEVIALIGAKPVFVDIDRKTYNMNPNLISKAISPRTKAIMPVSMYGQCAEFDAISAIGLEYGLPVIEDGAQSFGAFYHGRASCGLSKIGCTSFFPSKPLGCYGDGGACFTNDDELASKMREIRVHGQSKRYVHTSLGINGRFDTLQAAVLLEKLSIFPEEIELRQKVAHRYHQTLPDFLERPLILPYNQSIWAQYTIEVEDRESIQAELQTLGIPTAVHYPQGLHEQGVFKKLYPEASSYPCTEEAAKRVLSLPMHPYLSIENQDKIALALDKVLSKETMSV